MLPFDPPLGTVTTALPGYQNITRIGSGGQKVVYSQSRRMGRQSP